MKAVKVRGTVIGKGISKICAPITGKTQEEIFDQAKAILAAGVDIVEWRIDWFQDILNREKLTETGLALRTLMGEVPILVTLRTKDEGGELACSSEMYREIYANVVEGGYADLIDVEIMQPERSVEAIVTKAHAAGVYVVASNHDFHKTPDNAVMMARFGRMQRYDADIFKIAVMPVSKKDVVRLIEVTENASCFDKPIITMAMSGLGLLTRLGGEIYGSAVTFGCVGKASAPGQIEVSQLKTVLQMLHTAYNQSTAVEQVAEMMKEGSMKKNIFLVGFMGTGKTTLSRYLSKHLGFRELDMDQTIEEEQQMPITEIFAKKGESYFRGLETQLLVDLQSQKGLLVSCGGGVVLREENVLEMKKSGVIVLLTATPETILERVKDDDSRPLLRGNKNVQFIADMLEKRGPKYYAAADIILPTDGKATADIVKDFCEQLLASDDIYL